VGRDHFERVFLSQWRAAVAYWMHGTESPKATKADAFDTREAWVGPLRLHLLVESCTPENRRREPELLAAEALATLPRAMPRPEGVAAAVRAVLGPKHRKLGAGDRGGGRTHKRGPKQAAEAIRVKLRGASADAAFLFWVCMSVEGNPGASAREIRRWNGGNMGRTRRALATLEQQRAIERRGSDRNPSYFVTGPTLRR